MEIKAYLILVLNGLSVCMGRGPHHPHGQTSKDHKHHKPSSSQSLLSDTQVLHDTKHLEEDSKILTAEALAKMTPEELEFHYFSSHDYDKNSKLDGLEMLKVSSEEGGVGFDIRTGVPLGILFHAEVPVIEQAWLSLCAVYHTIEHVFPEDDEEDSIENEIENLEAFVAIVDRTLRLDDTDDDGYVSYVEYKAARVNNTEDRSPRILIGN